MRAGEAFASQVIKAVMTGPGWPRTLLIWLYDNHGGYYDHVRPPPAPDPDSVPGRTRFTRLPLLRRLPFGRQVLRSPRISHGRCGWPRLVSLLPMPLMASAPVSESFWMPGLAQARTRAILAAALGRHGAFSAG